MNHSTAKHKITSSKHPSIYPLRDMKYLWKLVTAAAVMYLHPFSRLLYLYTTRETGLVTLVFYQLGENGLRARPSGFVLIKPQMKAALRLQNGPSSRLTAGQSCWIFRHSRMRLS